MGTSAGRTHRIAVAVVLVAASQAAGANAADFAAPHPDRHLVAQVSAIVGPPARLVEGTVPVVGCPADGQQGALPAPALPASVRILVPDGQQQRLAYYKAEPTQGVVAPKGWKCFGFYGSDGDILLVAPADSNPRLFALGQAKTAGPAVIISTSYGGTSGRFQVAAIGARVFPVIRKFVESVRDEGLSDPKDYVFARWPADTIDRLSGRVVAYATPGPAQGLGSSPYLAASGEPVRGIAFLSGGVDEPNVVVLRVRLGGNMESLYAAIAVNALPGAATTAPSQAPSGPGGDWVPVDVARFGCGAKVPSSVFPQPQVASANGDGMTLRAADGAVVRLLGRFTAGSETVADLEHGLRTTADFSRVAYRAAGPSWLVLSGYRGQTVYYTRVALSGDRSVVCTIDIEYPTDRRDIYDALTGEIANTLRVP